MADEIDTASSSAPDTLRLRTVFATVPYYKRSLAPAGSRLEQIPDVVRQRIIGSRSALPALSPRELALRFTDTESPYVSETSVLRKAYHRIKALPHVIPAPIAIIATRSPGLRRPARLASSSEIGSEALDVLP